MSHTCVSSMESDFEKFFSLEEAVSLLPFVKETFREARKELLALKDEVILYERMQQLQESGEGIKNSEANTTQTVTELVKQKWDTYENGFYKWVGVLTEKGIQVRDFRKGLIDFPYRTHDGSILLLCWHWGEEGIFYFHDLYEGFNGRQPISLLPE